MNWSRLSFAHGYRRVTFLWCYGPLAWAAWTLATVLLACALAWVLEQVGYRYQLDTVLTATVHQLRARSADTRAAFALAAAPPDFAAKLPAAPSTAEILQTMQHATEKDGALISALQAEAHAATPLTLGRTDLTLSIKASYPAVLTVVREVLGQYPGATLRSINLVRESAVAANLTAQSATLGMNHANVPIEARVTMAFWYPPTGLAVEVKRTPRHFAEEH